MFGDQVAMNRQMQFMQMNAMMNGGMGMGMGMTPRLFCVFRQRNISLRQT